MYNLLGISNELEELSIKVEEELLEIFKEIDKNCEKNSIKCISRK